MVPILWSWQEAMRMMWYVFVCSIKKSKVVRTCYWGGGSLLFVVLIKMVSNNTAFQVLAVIFENTVFILCNSLMRNFVKFSVFNIFGAS